MTFFAHTLHLDPRVPEATVLHQNQAKQLAKSPSVTSMPMLSI